MSSYSLVTHVASVLIVAGWFLPGTHSSILLPAGLHLLRISAILDGPAVTALGLVTPVSGHLVVRSRRDSVTHSFVLLSAGLVLLSLTVVQPAVTARLPADSLARERRGRGDLLVTGVPRLSPGRSWTDRTALTTQQTLAHIVRTTGSSLPPARALGLGGGARKGY